MFKFVKNIDDRIFEIVLEILNSNFSFRQLLRFDKSVYVEQEKIEVEIVFDTRERKGLIYVSSIAAEI